MRFGKKFLCCSVGCLMLGGVALSGCNNPMFDFSGYEYPDFPYADSDPSIDSWTQWEEDEIITIDWFIDSTSYSLPKEGSQVMDEILRKTGIKINFKNEYILTFDFHLIFQQRMNLSEITYISKIFTQNINFCASVRVHVIHIFAWS